MAKRTVKGLIEKHYSCVSDEAIQIMIAVFGEEALLKAGPELESKLARAANKIAVILRGLENDLKEKIDLLRMEYQQGLDGLRDEGRIPRTQFPEVCPEAEILAKFKEVILSPEFIASMTPELRKVADKFRESFEKGH
ncbi:MAG: hypothetical protein WC242_00490 [Candidatus Paceibacterota bacterium]|jgi:hypothetical protein